MQPVFVIVVMRLPFEHHFHLPVILAVEGPNPFVLVNVSPLHVVTAACEPPAASAVCTATALVMVMLAKTAASRTNR